MTSVLQNKERDFSLILPWEAVFLVYWLLSPKKSESVSPLVVSPRTQQSVSPLCDPTDCSLPGISVHGILQARSRSR